jgi:hypothetical protein
MVMCTYQGKVLFNVLALFGPCAKLIGSICPGTSVNKYQSTLRNISEDRRAHLRGREA